MRKYTPKKLQKQKLSKTQNNKYARTHAVKKQFGSIVQNAQKLRVIFVQNGENRFFGKIFLDKPFLSYGRYVRSKKEPSICYNINEPFFCRFCQKCNEERWERKSNDKTDGKHALK